MLFAALGANAANQALCQNGFDGGRNQKRGDPHILHPGDRAGRIVGVQRTEHCMSRQRRLDRNLCRFQVANLADQDFVGILPQNGSQAF